MWRLSKEEMWAEKKKQETERKEETCWENRWADDEVKGEEETGGVAEEPEKKAQE